jgi:hypothetical protein
MKGSQQNVPLFDDTYPILNRVFLFIQHEKVRFHITIKRFNYGDERSNFWQSF